MSESERPTPGVKPAAEEPRLDEELADPPDSRLRATDTRIESLLDPSLLCLEDAVALADNLMRFEPLLDVRLLQHATAGEDTGDAGIDGAKARRAIEILVALPFHRRILPLLTRLLRMPDAKLRSQAALLFSRASQSAGWARQQLADRDSRVRANAVEGLWGLDSEMARNVLREAAADGDPRVAANALVGLYFLNAGRPREIEEMAARNFPEFRASAAWAMGQTGDTEFIATLCVLRKDPDGAVRSCALRALMRIRKQGAAAPVDPGLPEANPAAASPPEAVAEPPEEKATP